MARRFVLALTLAALGTGGLLGACSDKGLDVDSGDDGAPGTTGTTGGDDGGGGGTVDLPDPRTSAAADPGCEDFEGTPIAGATGYFYGQFVTTADPDVWAGQEQWILFSNQAWRDVGEDDCVITWSTTATRTDGAGTCSTCDYGLTVQASIDIANTSCPEGLWEGEETFQVVYGVAVDGGTATYYYASSGNFLGTGHAADGGSNYLSDGSCLYF